MNSLLPDQVQVLSEVLQTDEILISARLQLTRAEVKAWLDGCVSIVKAHAGALLGRHYTLALDISTAGTGACSLTHLLEAVSTQPSIVSLDLKGKWVSNSPGSPTISAAMKRTEQSGGIEILVHGTYLYVILAGALIGERDAVDQTKLPPAGISFYRPTRQLRYLIRDHAGQEIARETGVKYWADKKKRILLAAPEKTEKIFQRSLLAWLRHYVVDKLRIYSETRGFGQDATDITVMTGQGDYVVEVKWMGVNEKGTKYDGGQVMVGVRQVGKYLDNDPRLISGTVVVYDASSSASVAEQLTDKKCMHGRCEMPEIVWLESETPSQVAAASSSSALTKGDRGKKSSSTKKGRG